MKRISGRGWLAIGVGGLLLLGCLAYWPFASALQIFSLKDDTLLCSTRMAKGEDFVIAFTHSVNRRPVYDTIRFEETQLRIVSSRFNSFGAGMPETSTEANTLSTTPDGWLIYAVNRPVPAIDLFVGRIANHTLHVRQEQVLLATLSAPGSSISLRPGKVNVIQLFTKRCL